MLDQLLPPSMFQSIALLPQADMPVTLLTRHSIRELANGQGLAGYNLQLTESGRNLAYAWGAYLLQHSDRYIAQCISSPIQRCLDTASLMIAGAAQLDETQAFEDIQQDANIDIVEQGLLVEPGSFVVDINQAAPYFRAQGALGFMNSFIRHDLPGMKHPIRGVLDILELLYKQSCDQAHRLNLAVSHDTILAALIAVIAGQQQILPQDWPEMMEGLFIWFEGDYFADAELHWIWRAEHHQVSIAHLLQQLRVAPVD
ncbi:histidine phosphatase family protein [Acinetobacter larvae]|uniref:Histidine phosphatase family protein n=1 Tax=Acinetobacter larvae TaxID=1789224 RepID=A0A1B2M0K6_9GAMM|nr:histidine phosphatase family protein [Acinetobacter larvae]AOA58691.1 histidine phosphatase family protein [Acinetobacter larvae]